MKILRWLTFLVVLAPGIGHADVSDSGSLNIAGQGIFGSTLTVQGSSFSVVGSSFVVINGKVGIGNANPDGFFEVLAGTFTVKTTGLVGIGTANPAAPMHVVSNQKTKTTLGLSQALLLENIDATAEPDSKQEIGFGYKGGTYQPVVIGHKITDNSVYTNGSFYVAARIGTGDSQPIEILTVTATGYVGVGNTAPSSQFTVGMDSFTVATTGIIGMPGQAMAIVTGTDGNDIPNGDAMVPVYWNTANKVTNAMWVATSSSTFTIPANGVYQISAHVQLQANGTGTARYLRLFKNSVEFSRGEVKPPDGYNQSSLDLHQVIYLSAGDTLQFKVGQDSNGSLQINANSNQAYASIIKLY
jgi:hypothetical protein